MSRRPDYRVGALDKRTDEKQSNVGAAWINPDGSISVTLEPFVVLEGGRHLLITLFKEQEK